LRFRNYIWVLVGLLFIASSLVPVEGQLPESPEPQSRSVLPVLFILGLTSILVSSFLALKRRNNLGVAVGLLFIASALVPLGGYRLEGSEGQATGVLWNFMMPTGLLCIVVGVVLFFHKRMRLEKKRLALVMFATGLLFFPLLFRQNTDPWLGLWSGEAGNFDVESRGWRLLMYFPITVALTSIFTSLLVWRNPSRFSDQD